MNNKIALTLALWSLIPSVSLAVDSSKWEGTWSKKAESALTFDHCQNSACHFLLRTKSSDAGCTQQGEAKINGTVAVLTPSGGFFGAPFQPNTYGCSVTADLKNGGVSLRPFTESCKAYCTGGSPSSTPFQKVSDAPYADSSACLTDSSAGRRLWCTTEEFQKRDDQFSKLAIDIETKNPAASKQLDTDFPEAAIKACLTLECLRAKYDEREKFLKELGKSATASSEKRQKDLETAGDPKVAKALVDQLSGVYKERFQNALVTGEEFTSENILEIVRVSDSSIYFKTHTAFYNGHECNAFGLAKFSKANVFYSKKDDCKITISIKGKDVELNDEGGTCKDQCGARGSLSHTTFPLSKKRAIKYMDLLKRSEDYKLSTGEK